MHACAHIHLVLTRLSIFPSLQALDPAQDVLVAFKQNHERLLPDHGFPVRLIIPGRQFKRKHTYPHTHMRTSLTHFPFHLLYLQAT